MLNLKGLKQSSDPGTKGSGDQAEVRSVPKGDQCPTPRTRSASDPPGSHCEAPLVISCRNGAVCWPSGGGKDGPRPPIQGFRPESPALWPRRPSGSLDPRPPDPYEKAVQRKLSKLPLTQLYGNSVQGGEAVEDDQ